MDRENDIFGQPSKVQNMNFIFEDEAAPSGLDETQSVPASRRMRQAESNGSSVQRGRRVEGASSSQRQRAQRTSGASRSAGAPQGSRASQAQAGRPVQSQAGRSAQAPSGRAAQQASLAARAAQAQAGRSAQPQTGRTAQAPSARSQQARPAQAAGDGLSAQSRAALDEMYKSYDVNFEGQTDADLQDFANRNNIRQAQPKNVNADNARQPRNIPARSIDEKSASAPRKAQPKKVTSGNAQRPRKAQPKQAQPRKVNPSAQSRTGRPSSDAGNVQDARRINRSSSKASSRGQRGGKGKRSSGFKKFFLIYCAALLAILIIGLIIFGSFLKSLEKSQPSNIAQTVANNLTANKASSFLKDNTDIINCFGEPDDLISQFASGVEGVESLSYIENKDYRADAPSYNITADGKTVAKLTLKKDGSGSFGLSKWAIDRLDIADYMDTASYEFLAPVGTTITINGVELDDKYLTGEETIPQTLETAAKYVTIPSYLTYKVAGIAGTPEISAKDPNGNELIVTAAGSKYVVGSATDQQFIDSVSTLVDNALQAWGKHFINMGGNLSAYMLEGSDWYSYIFGGPDMDPIYTAFYEYESIADYSFTEKSATNYIRYTNDCFTVDVNYKMQINFNTDRMSDNNQKLDATWVFITQNGGQDWYLVDCIYK